VVSGTAEDDLLVVTATGVASGSYQLTTDVNGSAGGPFVGPVVNFTNTTSFTFNGLGDNDLLRINNPAGGIFAPAGGISYNGGGQAGDALENLGGVADSGTYAVGPGNGDGTITHTSGAVTQTITFTGLAPALDTVSEATFTITATNGVNTITLDDGAATGDGPLRVSIDPFE